MRKQWLKKEDIYHKPFYKKKAHIYLLAVLLLGVIFIFYQVYTVSQLTQKTQKKRQWTFDEAINDFKQRHNEMMKKLGFSKDEDESEWTDPAMHNIQDIKIVRGTRLYDYDAYKPNYLGKFKCLDGSKEIDWIKVNDDYCDCLNDGSDEPSTNACINGRFYCAYQKRHITGRGQDIWVPSSRINDNVCDCCDGSDEWDVENIKCDVNCV